MPWEWPFGARVAAVLGFLLVASGVERLARGPAAVRFGAVVPETLLGAWRAVVGADARRPFLMVWTAHLGLYLGSAVGTLRAALRVRSLRFSSSSARSAGLRRAGLCAQRSRALR